MRDSAAALHMLDIHHRGRVHVADDVRPFLEATRRTLGISESEQEQLLKDMDRDNTGLVVVSDAIEQMSARLPALCNDEEQLNIALALMDPDDRGLSHTTLADFWARNNVNVAPALLSKIIFSVTDGDTTLKREHWQRALAAVCRSNEKKSKRMRRSS